MLFLEILLFVQITTSLSISEIFECHQHVFLVLVMLGGPLILNGIQLLIQDQFLKESYKTTPFWKNLCTRQRKKGNELDDSLMVLRV